MTLTHEDPMDTMSDAERQEAQDAIQKEYFARQDEQLKDQGQASQVPVPNAYKYEDEQGGEEGGEKTEPENSETTEPEEKSAGEEGGEKTEDNRRYRPDLRTRRQLARVEQQRDAALDERSKFEEQLKWYKDRFEKAKENPAEAAAEGVFDAEPPKVEETTGKFKPTTADVKNFEAMLAGENAPSSYVDQMVEAWPEVVSAVNGLHDPLAAIDTLEVLAKANPEGYRALRNMSSRDLHETLLRAEVAAEMKGTEPPERTNGAAKPPKREPKRTKAEDTPQRGGTARTGDDEVRGMPKVPATYSYRNSVLAGSPAPKG